MFLKRAGTMFIFSIMLLLLIPIVAPSPQEKQSDTLRWFLSPPENRLLPSMVERFQVKSDVCSGDAESLPTYPMAGQTSLSYGPMNSSWPMYCHDVRHTSRSPYIRQLIRMWRNGGSVQLVDFGYKLPRPLVAMEQSISGMVVIFTRYIQMEH